MSWRVNTASVDGLEFQVMSVKRIDVLYGYEHEESEQNERALVITDQGNMEAWVIRGNPVARQLMLRRLRRALATAPR